MTTVEDTQTMALLDARYQLHERVGVGGMAEIFRAEDVVLGRTVAIKLMRPEAAVLASPARTQREADALAVLNHPAVVTLLDARISGDGPRYLVMEFVEGPTLADALQHGALSPVSVVRLASEIAAGLEAVHEANFVHRDIKPANILLARPSRSGALFDVKLADFGLAQLTDSPSVTRPGVVLGTAAYIAPEQARGNLSGPPADIYSFGLVLLEALTGERPFKQASGIGVVTARLLEDPAVPENVHPQWAQLIRQMTAAVPEARPTAREVAEILAGLPAPDPVAAPSAAPLDDDHDEIQTAIVPLPAMAQPAVPRLRVRHRPARRRMPKPVIVATSLAAAVLACVVTLAPSLAAPGSGTEAGTYSSVDDTQPEAFSGSASHATPAAVVPTSSDKLTAETAVARTVVSPTSSSHRAAKDSGKDRTASDHGTPTGGRGKSGGHAGTQPNPPHQGEHGKGHK